MVSTRSVGELLTTDIRGDQLRVLLFSRPDGQAHFAVRIASLLDTAVDTADQDPGPHPIPPLLLHTMQVVVELIQDLAETTGEPASAVAFYGSAREVAFAHADGLTVEFDSTGPVDVGWVSLNDPDSEAVVEARAFSLLSRPDLDVSLRWSYSTQDSGLDGVEVDAQWKGPSHVAVQVRTMSGEIVSSARAVGGRAGRGAFFAGWFEDLEAPATGSLGARDSAPDPEWSGEENDEPAVYEEQGSEGRPSDDETVYDDDSTSHDAPRPVGRAATGTPMEDEGAWGNAESQAPSGGGDDPSARSSRPGSLGNAPGARVNLTTPAWEWPPRFPDLEGPGASDAHAEASPGPEEPRAKAARPPQKPAFPPSRTMARPPLEPPAPGPSRNAWPTHAAPPVDEDWSASAPAEADSSASGERIYEIPEDDDEPMSQGAPRAAGARADREPRGPRDRASRASTSAGDSPDAVESDVETHRTEAVSTGPPRWSDQEETGSEAEPEPAAH